MKQEIRELKRRIELKEQEIFLSIENQIKELKSMKEKLTDLYEKEK